MISTDDIKKLRAETGVSIMQCRKALEEAGGDIEKAKIVLRKFSSNAASKKADRELGSGVVRSYVHSNNQLGVLVELNCETDFVAKNEEFIKLADDIAMHAAAMSPEFISATEISDENRATVKAIMESEVANMDKPEDIKAKILESKISDYFAAKTLLDQAFVKQPDITVGKLIEEGTQKLGEKIQIGRMVRYNVLEG